MATSIPNWQAVTRPIGDEFRRITTSTAVEFRKHAWVAVVLGLLCLWQYPVATVQAVLLSGLVLVAVTVVRFEVWLRSRRAALQVAEMEVPPRPELKAVYRKERERSAYLVDQWPTVCKALTTNKQWPQMNRLAPNLTSDFKFSLACGRLGIPVSKVQAQTELIREVFGCKEVIVTPTASGCCEVQVNWSDPMGRTLYLPDLPTSKAGTIAYGVRRDGTAATIEQDKSVLIGGLTGFGKSNIIWTMLADLIRKGVPIRLYVSDPKGGIELPALAAHKGEQMGNVQVMQYASTAAETVEMVTDVEKRMRFSQSKQQGRKHKPTPENPLCIVLLDELLPLHEMIAQKNKGPLGKILYEGRASGYVVWANAQTAHESVLGVMRNFIPQRLSVKTKSQEMTDTILGTGATARGALCHLIDPKHKGVGFSEADSAVRPDTFRAPLVKDSDVERIAVGAMPAGMQTKDKKERRCFTYRNYSFDLVGPDGTVIPRNELEYVGKALNPAERFEKHRAEDWAFCPEHGREENWWLVHVDESKTKIEEHPSEEAALVAEKQQIESDLPRWNYVYNKRNPIAVRWQKAQRRISSASEGRQERRAQRAAEKTPVVEDSGRPDFVPGVDYEGLVSAAVWGE